jgi:RNA polymerase sigma-70 factor, ECF subfamily
MSGYSPATTAADAAGRDTQLLNRLASGDVEAVSELYDLYAARVFGLALRIVGNRTDAEDVVQEVFSQAWRTAGQYQPQRGSVAAWLMVIARTRAIDRLRSRRASDEPLPETDHHEFSSSAPAPGDELIAREQADQVRSAVMLLPDEQRRALELAYFEGLSQSEIAAKLQTPLGTVKTRIRTALTSLRRSLRP